MNDFVDRPQMTLRYSEDLDGNRSTTAMYRDADGASRTTRLNGHLSTIQVQASLQYHRKRTK